MKIHRMFAMLAMAAATASPALASSNLSYSTDQGDSAPQGTRLAGTIEQTITTKEAHVGDTFVLDETALPNQNPAFNGAKIYGHVAHVVRAGQGREATLQLAFDRIVFPDGYAAPLDASVVAAPTQTKDNTPKEIAAAVVGDVLGNYLGKHVGTKAGGAVGAAGGYLYAVNSHNDLTLSQGTTVSLRLNTDLDVRRYPQRPQRTSKL
jgi:hypothetical protein